MVMGDGDGDDDNDTDMNRKEVVLSRRISFFHFFFSICCFFRSRAAEQLSVNAQRRALCYFGLVAVPWLAQVA